MSNKQQTAVDWLEYHINIGLTYEQQIIFEGLFQQAKEMEKQQIMDAYNSDRPLLSCFEDESAANEYYNENYETSN